MKKSEIIEEIREKNCEYKDFKEDTYFYGYDGVTYDAKATFRIHEDGRHEIMRYSYIDEDGDSYDIEERDWDKHSVEITFGIEIDC